MANTNSGNAADGAVRGTVADLGNMTHASTAELQAYYDKWATSYEKDLLGMGYDAPVHAADIMVDHDIAPHGAILDAGCGTGLTGLELARKGYGHVTGVDISPESLKLAEDKDAYEHLQIQDMNKKLAFETDRFHAAQCIGALTYVDNMDGLMREFCRVVQPGGIVAFTHRIDLYDDAFERVLNGIAKDGLWSVITHSDPQPYIPDHNDFGDEKLIHYDIYRVH
jgi:predicted TPR repeat methyltransferase